MEKKVNFIRGCFFASQAFFCLFETADSTGAIPKSVDGRFPNSFELTKWNTSCKKTHGYFDNYIEFYFIFASVKDIKHWISSLIDGIIYAK